MKGYLSNEEATKKTIDADQWMHTGDIAYYDEASHFFIVDRLKELIKVKGYQVNLFCTVRFETYRVCQGFDLTLGKGVR